MDPNDGRLALPDEWYVACAASELRDAPMAFSLGGERMVLFRDARRAPAALSDRCSHRNVPLSMGRCVSGEVECPYHGWRFDPRGECTAIPGLVTDLTKGARGRKVSSFAAAESDGYIWVYSTPDAEPKRPPYAVPFVSDSRYVTITHVQDFEGTVHSVAENALDVPHTAFVHKGLFRGTSDTRSEIDVVVRRYGDRIEAEYIGEARPEGLIGRLLAPGGGVVIHFDRFLLPCVAQVEYRLGDDSHVLATTMLTPISETLTRMFASVSFRAPVPAALVAAAVPAIKPVALRILRQDVRILARQVENIRHFGGEAYASTELDVLGGGIRKLLRAGRGDDPSNDTPSSERKLVMRV